MPKILATRCTFAPHTVPQERIRDTVAELFAGKFADLPRLLTIFDNARIASRDLMMPLAWYRQPRSPSERNRIYREAGGTLLVAAARDCLAGAGLVPGQIDHVIFVSTTGLATPTLDVHLINELGLRPTTTRLPVWGLGCAGGAAGLSRAFDHCLAHPGARVLVTALECCSLTFLEGDRSRKNLVATALFSDGAAAATVVGDAVTAQGVQILATRSHLFPGTARVMGWKIRDEGMELVLSPRLPALIKEGLAGVLGPFLSEQGVGRGELVHYLLHPGGARIIDACREALALHGTELALCEEVLRRHGNTSSVSVLAVLEQWLAAEGRRRPGLGLLGTFGPGFSAELLLLRS